LSLAQLVPLFLAAFGVGLSGALVPGPLLALNLAETARRGFWAAPALVLGHGLLEAALVVALALGLSRFLQAQALTATVGFFGGMVLGWMAYSLLRQPRAGNLVSGGGKAGPALVLGGVVVSLANPYWLLWCATVGSTFVVWALGLGLLGLVAFYWGHVLSDLSWYSLVGFLVARGRGLSARLYRGLMLACALFLVFLGGVFVFAGLKYWLG